MTDQKYRFTLLALSVLGFADAIYLTIEKLTANQQMCIPGLGDCWTVNNSSYSEVFGIPIAILGAGAYLFLALTLLFENRVSFLERFATPMVMGITLTGVLYSAFLTYIEVAVLKAICPFCVVSAIIMVLLFSLSIARLVHKQAYT
jgi:uncharacterized membrane protein